MTVHEVSRLTGVTVRALHHYDRIGLLPATEVTEAGYRLYDDGALARLQQILLFRELEFPLREIREILDSPGFDRDRALIQQIELLKLRREHLRNLIDLACEMQKTGGNTVKFDAFDTKKLDEYAAKAKAEWGNTEAYREFEEKTVNRSSKTEKDLAGQLMDIFAEFGTMHDRPLNDPAVAAQVEKLQRFISEHYYHCTDEILLELGAMYAAGGAFTENIDKAGGNGTADFVNRAIQAAKGK